MTKIENMIDLRLRCLELALEFYNKADSITVDDVQEVAQGFSEFILGDSELPKSPISMDRVLYETMLKMMESNDYNGKELEKLKETLANSKQE